MAYESAQHAAQRLSVSVRTIERWARDGVISGVARQGRTWMLPTDFVPAASKGSRTLRNGHVRTAMPLLNGAYPVGRCREFIETIPDEDERTIAWGEYYYFSGQPEQAARTMEPYQDSTDQALRYSANLVGFFANFALGRTHLAVHAAERLQTDLSLDMKAEAVPQLRATGMLAVTASAVLLHLPMTCDVDLRQVIAWLPGGLKLWACYMLAHRAYLEKDYSGSLGMAELALNLSPQTYPIAAIYVHLVIAMDLMSLKRVDEARQHVADAWTLAQEDGIIEPFGEHHGLLQGMVELFFRKDYPEAFDRIIAITYSFSASWRKIHRLASQHEVADNLTTTEFTVAMLYNRG